MSTKSCGHTWSFFVNEKPVVENLEIKAVDDVSAYEKAVGEINRICEGKEDEWLYAKLNYTLYNGEDKIYMFSTVIPELLVFVKLELIPQCSLPYKCRHHASDNQPSITYYQ